MSAYARVLAELLQLARFGMRPGLTTTEHLLERLGNPHRDLAVLHVAGTNGKGSVCRFSHALLQRRGLRTGLFTSPHLVCLRERFVIDDRAIEESELVELLEHVLPIARELQATFFETLTAAAALWFRDHGVEACVLETGLGGRLDSTRVFPAQVCVVTQVGMDHVEILGPTLLDIWREKIAILRQGGVLITAETRPELREELLNLSRTLPGEVEFLEPPPSPRSDLPNGEMQVTNFALALRAVEHFLGERLAEPEIHAALGGLRWPARRERVAGSPEVWLDVAHNPDGALLLAQEVRSSRPVLLMGVLGDKDWREVVACLLPAVFELHWLPLDTARALPAEVFAAAVPEAILHPDSASAWKAASARAEETGRPLLVAGSFHTVGQALRFLHAEGRYAFWPAGIVPDPELPGWG